MTPENAVLQGDCVDVMATFDAESIDAIVTDPPYGLGFMGKAWDSIGDTGRGARARIERAAEVTPVGQGHSSSVGPYLAAGIDSLRSAGRPYQEWCYRWATEALRVAKPGAHLLAFGGTRTYHRLACAIEDAGWEIRDCLVWAYASGFPKSHNLDGDWKGWGTALKPAWEPIVLARKPFRGTVAANVATHGTGALNIDGARIGPPLTPEEIARTSRLGEPSATRRYPDAPVGFVALPGPRGGAPAGRWPPNLVLTDAIFDGDMPGVVGGGYQESTAVPGAWAPRGAFPIDNPRPTIYGDSGTYSRFFLVPKADRSDREPVLGGLAVVERAPTWGDIGPVEGNPRKPNNGHVTRRANTHPTVKPTELMRHLIRLVAPPGGLVLDPFLGSGTTALAAEMEGFRWLGIEREEEYVSMAEARLNGTQRGMGLVG